MAGYICPEYRPCELDARLTGLRGRPYTSRPQNDRERGGPPLPSIRNPCHDRQSCRYQRRLHQMTTSDDIPRRQPVLLIPDEIKRGGFLTLVATWPSGQEVPLTVPLTGALV